MDDRVNGRFKKGFSCTHYGRQGYKKGKSNPKFKGIRYHSSGYVLIYQPNHPFKQHDGYVPEHRVIFEEYLKTHNPESPFLLNGYLNARYIVHHKDHNIINNHIENLEVFTQSEHMKIRHKRKKEGKLYKCEVCQKEVYRKNSRRKYYHKVFCSKTHYHLYLKGKPKNKRRIDYTIKLTMSSLQKKRNC
jgi:hypothetical protein